MQNPSETTAEAIRPFVQEHMGNQLRVIHQTGHVSRLALLGGSSPSPEVCTAAAKALVLMAGVSLRNGNRELASTALSCIGLNQSSLTRFGPTFSFIEHPPRDTVFPGTYELNHLELQYLRASVVAGANAQPRVGNARRAAGTEDHEIPPRTPVEGGGALGLQLRQHLGSEHGRLVSSKQGVQWAAYEHLGCVLPSPRAEVRPPRLSTAAKRVAVNETGMRDAMLFSRDDVRRDLEALQAIAPLDADLGEIATSFVARTCGRVLPCEVLAEVAWAVETYNRKLAPPPISTSFANWLDAEGWCIEFGPGGESGWLDRQLLAPNGNRSAVFHADFHLAKDLQGCGFKAILSLAQDRLYQKLGARVETMPAESGAYVWALDGFEAESPEQLEAVKRDVLRYLDRHRGLLERAGVTAAQLRDLAPHVAGARSMRELASLGFPPGGPERIDVERAHLAMLTLGSDIEPGAFTLGKLALLGAKPEWTAVKDYAAAEEMNPGVRMRSVYEAQFLAQVCRRRGAPLGDVERAKLLHAVNREETGDGHG